MKLLLACVAFAAIASWFDSARASAPLSTIKIAIPECKGVAVDSASAKIWTSSWGDTLPVAATFSRSSDDTGSLTFQLAPGYYDMSIVAGPCEAHEFVGVLAGHDRAFPADWHSGSVLYDPAAAVAGSIPAGVDRAVLYRVDGYGEPTEARVEAGAFYAGRLSFGRYLMRLSGRKMQPALVAVDARQQPFNTLQIRDVSLGECLRASARVGSPLSNPTSIGLGYDGAMWFLNPSGNSVGRIDSRGAIQTFALPDFASVPTQLIAGKHAMWVVEWRALKMVRIDGRSTHAFAIPIEGSRLDIGTAVLGSDDRLWFEITNDSFQYSLFAMDDRGQFNRFPSPGGRIHGDPVLGPDGRIWLPRRFHISAIATDGKATDYAVGADTLFAGTRFMWASGLDPGEILRIAVDGSETHIPIPHEEYNAQFLGETPDGKVWIADPHFSAIAAIRITDEKETGEDIVVAPKAEDAIVGPGGCIWRSQGAYVVGCNGTAYHIKPYGSDPGKMAADGVGNLWFTEEDANAVGVVRANGSVDIYPLPRP